MMDYAVIPAAGILRKPWLWKPKAFLTIGEETVIVRLIRQIKARNIFPLVGIGTSEKMTGGGRPWGKVFVRLMHILPCETLTSPYQVERSGWKTTQFLLRHLLEKPELKDSSKIVVISGDYVFEDAILDEILTYPMPGCVFLRRSRSKKTGEILGDSQVLLLTGRILKDFLDLALLEMNSVFLCCRHWEELARLGFHPIKYRDRRPFREFVEIDGPGSWEAAIRLVAREARQTFESSNICKMVEIHE